MTQNAKPLVVSKEGIDMGVGYIIKPGALECLDETVPVVWGTNPMTRQVVGQAGNCRREGNDLIMDIELNDDIPLDLEDGIVGSVYVTPVRQHRETNPLTKMFYPVVDYGRIREVQIEEKR